jgi:ABC-2 type transport system ATP-binding protein
MNAITVRNLTKRCGGVTAVDDLSFDIEHGTITGFVGPNGSGKTTTLRAILGLNRVDHGSALIDGLPYASLDRPAAHVGAVLEPSFHPGRTGRITCGWSRPLWTSRRRACHRFWRMSGWLQPPPGP